MLRIIVVYIMKIMVYLMIGTPKYDGVCVKNSNENLLHVIMVFVMSFCGKEKLRHVVVSFYYDLLWCLLRTSIMVMLYLCVQYAPFFG